MVLLIFLLLLIVLLAVILWDIAFAVRSVPLQRVLSIAGVIFVIAGGVSHIYFKQRAAQVEQGRKHLRPIHDARASVTEFSHRANALHSIAVISFGGALMFAGGLVKWMRRPRKPTMEERFAAFEKSRTQRRE